MIKVLEQAIERIRDLPKERQEVAAEALRVIAAQSKRSALTEREIEGVKQAQREIRKGKFASDWKVKSLFARFRA